MLCSPPLLRPFSGDQFPSTLLRIPPPSPQPPRENLALSHSDFSGWHVLKPEAGEADPRLSHSTSGLEAECLIDDLRVVDIPFCILRIINRYEPCYWAWVTPSELSMPKPLLLSGLLLLAASLGCVAPEPAVTRAERMEAWVGQLKSTG